MKERISLGKLYKLWWIPMVIGLIAIGLGIWTLCAPAESIMVLGYIFAGCLCVAGVLQLVYSGLMSRFSNHWGWSLVIGLLDIVAGVWMFCLPEVQMATTFMLIMGIWLLCVAIDSIAESAVMASYSPGWMIWMILLLVATIFLAIIFLTNPVEGGILVWMWIGISLICYGTYRVSLAFAVRSSRL